MRPQLAVYGGSGPFAAIADGAVRVKSRPEVHVLAGVALQFGEDASDRLGIVINVRTGPLTAADPFPAPEPARSQPVGGARRQDGRVDKRPVQEPVGQRRVVPRLVPELGIAAEAGVV